MALGARYTEPAPPMNVIPFLGRPKRRPGYHGNKPVRPAAPPPPPPVKTALQACLAPPQPGDRYHVAPIWRGDYRAGFSVWDSGRDGVTPRRVRSFMVSDLGLHVAASNADSLRVALNDEWLQFLMRKVTREATR